MKSHIHRPIPCAPYDISGVQQFLQDMAAKGWILEKETIFCGYAKFRRSSPQTIRYRLTPSRDGKEPGEELHYAKAQGWEYRLLWNEFHIYACSDPEAPELDTDPRVMALAMSPLVRRSIGQLVVALFLSLNLPLWGSFWGSLLHRNGWAIAMTLVMLALNLVGRIRNLSKCLSIRNRLRNGEPLPPTVDYRRKLWQFYLSFATGRLWGYGYLAMLIYLIAALFLTSNTMDFADYTRTVPFPVMADFMPEASESYSFNSQSRTIDAWESWLSEENYEYYEGYSLTLPDSTGITCTEHVLYHNTVSEAYAELLAAEKTRELNRKKFDTAAEQEIEGLDYCYLISGRSAAMVLRHDSTVVCVSFSMRYVEDEAGFCRDAMLRFAEVYASELEG